jgi:hypothetical protein
MWAMAAPHAVPIRLSTEDLISFDEALKAHTTAQRDVLRIRIVLLAYLGHTNLEIAAALGCDVTTVSKWRGRFAQHGRAGLRDQPRSGRPSNLSALQQALVISLLCQPQQTQAAAKPTAPLTGLELAAPSPGPEEATLVPLSEVAAPSPGPREAAFVPVPEVAAPSPGPEEATLVAVPEVAAPSPGPEEAALASVPEVVAAFVAEGSQPPVVQPNEVFATASATTLAQPVACADASACLDAIAPGTLDKAPVATPPPAELPVAADAPRANAPQDPPSPPQPKSTAAKKQRKKRANPKSSSKQRKKQRPEHERFARTQPSGQLDLSLPELGLARVDLVVAPFVETANVGPGALFAELLQPVSTTSRMAAVLGLPEEGGIVLVETPLVTATTLDLASAAAGVEPPALPFMTTTNPLAAALLATEVAGGVLPFATTTAFPGIPPFWPGAERAFTTKTSAKTPAVKRPLGCVLSLDQILTRMAEELNLTCSRSTLSRLLAKHELKPWRYQYWIFPQAANFAERAGPILDLYAGYWLGELLGPDEFVLSFDEKTSIQARWRLHETVPGEFGQPGRIEWGYGRGGALQYLACWDVRRGKVMGRCEAKVGIASFDRLVEEVMKQEPYRTAKRVFAIMDNGSSHRGQKCIERLEGRYPQLKVVHTPVHASWLNQIEIYFSIIERALLTPNDFHDLKHVENAIMAFQRSYNERATPFAWRYTRTKLAALLKKLEAHKRLAS